MSAGADGEEAAPPRADLADGVVWVGLGAAVLVGSVLMDRLGNQDVPPFAAPGLLPGLLGVVLVLMGGTLLVRGAAGGGLAPGPMGPRDGLLGPAPGRAAGVMALCVAFGAGLVGHGVPFWAAAAVFVIAAILFLRRDAAGGWRLGGRSLAFAAAVGLGAGLAITVVFQQLFLVRLP